MDPGSLHVLIEYNIWANNRILECAAKVPHEELARPANIDHGSAFQTLLHILDVEWSWRYMSAGVAAAEYLWEVEELPDLAPVQNFWEQEHERMLSYVQGLDEEMLDQEVDYGSLQGGPPHSAKVWHILAHVVNHGTHHRSELARYLTDCGHSPGDLDLLAYLSDALE